MTRFFLNAAAASIALATASMASAQHIGHMPGMTMPMPAATKTAPTKKPAAKKVPAKKSATRKASTSTSKRSSAKPTVKADHGAMDMGAMDMAPAAKGSTTPPAGQAQMDHGQMDHGQMPQNMPNMGQMDMKPAPQSGMPAMDHGQMDMGHSAMPGMPGMSGTAHGGHMAMNGALGPYGSTREASGTSWQPDSAEHMGYMTPAGDWMLMLHGHLDLIADTQSSRRGDSKVFPAGMVMGMATHSFANGDTFQARAMLSPDPLMGKSGYPLLLASGETADGTTRLIDRQHPHDLFMELSASYSLKLGAKNSAFLYAGLPGEPAFGPPAFMHRQSIMVSPEAPITHHWLDSTHITFGVVTAGLVLDRVKLEGSRFNGREPDQHRYDIETGPLDSTSLRVSWNPTRELSLQGSWAHLVDPEQLEPGVDQKRWSASAIYTRSLANGWWSSTLAWGRKTVEDQRQDAFALESAYKRGDWTLFGRGEMAENSELVPGLDHGPAYRVGKASLGLARDFDLAGPLGLTVGALGSVNFIPSPLADLYGNKHPLGAMGFVRVRID